MKKLICLAFAAVMSLSLIACGGNDSKSSPSKSTSADKATENAQQPAATNTPETTPDTESLSQLEQLEPFCGVFSYDEYYTSTLGTVNVSEAMSVSINEDNRLVAWMPSTGLVTIPTELYDDILSNGSCEITRSFSSITLTWSEDKQTLYFKYCVNDAISAEGTAKRDE